MPARVEADPFNLGAFRVMAGDTAQSWVDPNDPLRLEFEYVQRICEALDATVLARTPEERVRVVHLGGGGLTIPRYVAARRPGSAQIVCEPDADLIDEVRRLMPLPRHSGIKVRTVDGRGGLAAMPAGYIDALVLDAFDGPRVPASLATAEFFDEVAAKRRPGALFAANVTDKAPFAWARRFVAGVRAVHRHVIVSAEAPVWKGRRYGNLVVVASDAALPTTALSRHAARAAFAYRVLAGREVADWVGGAEPFTDGEPQPSPVPRKGTWFS
ncbi:MAG: fused MFS/spermidine synthase [Propioniciclava sp.]|uniref:spermidine synthase n=1 Tax=Propioniciclava sp. TaxID=2038686 RepID=UPI0039E417E7